jgi:hypothetical protein
MGKGSTRRPEDRKAIEANWPFKQHEQATGFSLLGAPLIGSRHRAMPKDYFDWLAHCEQIGWAEPIDDWRKRTHSRPANTNEEEPSKLPKE